MANVLVICETSDGSLKAHREIEGAEEIIEAPTPALITAQKGLNEPRYASLKGIMAAKKVPIDVKSIGDLGLSDDDVYDKRVRVTAMELPPEKPAGRKLEGLDPKAAAAEVIQFIREDAKAL